MRQTYGWLAPALLMTSALQATAQSNCGSLANSYGPFDYRVEHNGQIRVVDAYHFTPEVEALLRGKSGTIGGDIDYVLRASPNHHRALISLQRYAARLRTPNVPDMRYSVDCYFERALRFKGDDQVARMIFVTHLMATQRGEQAREQLGAVATQAGDSPFTHHNLGLLYLDLKDYDKAREHAHRALALGLQRHDLRDKLVQAGQWREPQEAAAVPAGGAASAPEPAAPASGPAA